MAATKSSSSLDSAVTLTAGAGNHTSSSGDLTTSYGGILEIKLANGGTGPTIAAQSQVQISGDNSAFFDYGAPLVGSTTNSATATFSVELPIGVMYVRVVSGSNTAQNVTLDVVLQKVTGV